MMPTKAKHIACMLCMVWLASGVLARSVRTLRSGPGNSGLPDNEWDPTAAETENNHGSNPIPAADLGTSAGKVDGRLGLDGIRVPSQTQTSLLPGDAKTADQRKSLDPLKQDSIGGKPGGSGQGEPNSSGVVQAGGRPVTGSGNIAVGQGRENVEKTETGGREAASGDGTGSDLKPQEPAVVAVGTASPFKTRDDSRVTEEIKSLPDVYSSNKDKSQPLGAADKPHSESSGSQPETQETAGNPENKSSFTGVVDNTDTSGTVGNTGPVDRTDTSGTVGNTGPVDKTDTSGTVGNTGSLDKPNASGTVGNTGSLDKPDTSGTVGNTGPVDRTDTSGTVGNTGSLDKPDTSGTVGNTGSLDKPDTSGTVVNTGSLDKPDTSGTVGDTGPVDKTDTSGTVGDTGPVDRTDTSGTVGNTGPVDRTDTSGTVGNTGSVDRTDTSGTVGNTGSLNKPNTSGTVGNTDSSSKADNLGTPGNFDFQDEDGDKAADGTDGPPVSDDGDDYDDEDGDRDWGRGQETEDVGGNNQDSGAFDWNGGDNGGTADPNGQDIEHRNPTNDAGEDQDSSDNDWSGGDNRAFGDLNSQGNEQKPTNGGENVPQNKEADRGDYKPSLADDYSYSEDESPSSGHFFGFFLTAVVICISGYIIYHNKQKIMAFCIEGRNGPPGRRRSNGVKYSQLKSSVEEVMPSLEKTTTAKNFVY